LLIRKFKKANKVEIDEFYFRFFDMPLNDGGKAKTLITLTYMKKVKDLDVKR